MRVPVRVVDGKLICPCCQEPMVKARDQSQAKPGETLWQCPEYAAVIEPYIQRQLADRYAGERNPETGSAYFREGA